MIYTDKIRDQQDIFPDIDAVDELPRLKYSAELLRNPFKVGERFADNVTTMGKVSYEDGVIFIDIDENTPVAVSRDAAYSLSSQLDIKAPTFMDVQKGDFNQNSLIVGGSIIGVKKSGGKKQESVRYAMLKRGLYLHDNPESVYLVTPLALDYPSGGAAERLSETMLKEAQEEIQIFLMGRNKNSNTSKLIDSFGETVESSIYPVRMVSKGKTGLSEEDHKKIISEYSTHVFTKLLQYDDATIEFPLDHSGDLDYPLSFLDRLSLEPKDLKVQDDESRAHRINKVVTRINGEVFDVAEGIPYIDVRYNTFELTKPLILEIPRDKKVIHLLGCEPDFGKQSHFFSHKQLLKMTVAAKMPFDDGVEPGGLSRSAYAFFNEHPSSLSFETMPSGNSSLDEIAQQKELERDELLFFSENGSTNSL